MTFRLWRCFIPRNNLDLEDWGKLCSNGIELDAEDLIANGFSIFFDCPINCCQVALIDVGDGQLNEKLGCQRRKTRLHEMISEG